MLPLQQKFPLVCYEKAMKKDTIREGPTIVLNVRLGRTQGLTVLPENLIGITETQENDLCKNLLESEAEILVIPVELHCLYRLADAQHGVPLAPQVVVRVDDTSWNPEGLSARN